ncbi:hypothetical protein ACHAXS_005884 [Conticribra weissflogii]
MNSMTISPLATPAIRAVKRNSTLTSSLSSLSFSNHFNFFETSLRSPSRQRRQQRQRPPSPQPTRPKSSIPSNAPPTPESETPHSIYERAKSHALAFDRHHHLLSSPSWRQTQMRQTRLSPTKPHPRLPPKFFPPHRPPNSRYPPSFFPPYAHTSRPGPPAHPPHHVLLHDPPSVARMTSAAKLARRLLDVACHPSLARAGRTTEDVDALVHDRTLASGAYPSPLNYMGFPKSICSSVNEVVCHGIPDGRELREGDVVSFDVSCYVGGVHGDNCGTVIVGDCDFDENGISASALPEWNEDDYYDLSSDCSFLKRDWRNVPYRTEFSSEEERMRFVTARRLVQAALESRDEGVKACRPGGCLSDIGAAIHAVADAYGYDTVRHYRGHGIGTDFHCAPFVKHFRNDDKLELLPGMIFTIEPMIVEGTAECIEWDDQWTVATEDFGRAAQFEHTVLITETGVEILTLP